MRAAFSADRKQKEHANARKYGPGPDPLEEEQKLQIIVPSSAHEQSQMLKLVKRLIEKTKDESEQRALKMWKANLKADQLKGVVQQEFLRDFWGWLIGRGKQQDHDRTPWGRQSLADDHEVSNYVDAFVTKMFEFRLKLAQLRMRRPVGINQVYLFFKYVVRGEEINKSNFLDDWSLFQDEFFEARNRGQFYRDLKDYPYPHETAPYGDERKRMANEVEKKRRDAGPQTGDSDDEVASAPIRRSESVDEQPEIREMDEKDLESQHPDVPDSAAAAQSYADVLDSVFELHKTPEQRVADIDAAIKLAESQLEEMDTTEDAVEVDEKNSTLEALETLKKQREDHERDRGDKERKRRERIRAGTAKRAAQAIHDRVNQLGKNAAEGLQTMQNVAQEAAQMREDIQARENMDLSNNDPETAEQFVEIQVAMFAAETTEQLFRSQAEAIPAVTAKLRKEAEKPAKAAETFQPPEPGKASFVAAVVENSRFLPKSAYVATVSASAAVEDAVAKTADLPDSGEKRTRQTGDPFSEETGPVDEQPEKTGPVKKTKAVEDELVDTVENLTAKVAPKTRRAKRSAQIAAKSAAKLSGALQSKSRLSEVDQRLRDRLRAEKVASESRVDEIIEQVARQREKIARAAEGVKRTIETEEAALPTANEAATKSAEQLESEYDRVSREISRKQRHIAKDAKSDVARVEAFIQELRNNPTPPHFTRTTVSPPSVNVQPSAREEVDRVASGRPPPVAPQVVRTTVTQPTMNVQPSAQDKVNRVASGQPPPVAPQFVRTTQAAEPPAPQFVRTTVTPPTMNVQPSAQDEVNRVASGQPPPVAPQFVRTTVPPKEKEEEDDVVEMAPAEQKPEKSDDKTLPAERRGFTAGMTEEEFDRAIKNATAAAIEMEVNKFNQVLFDIRELAGRYAPELMPHIRAWDGRDQKQKEHLIELSVEVNRRIQKLGQRVSRPINRDFAKRLKEKAEKRREKVKLQPKFGGKVAEWIENRPRSQSAMEENN
jgi:hypothetical protein